MPDPVPEPPKVFLSYSWTSDDYIARIERLAEDLTHARIDVVFDQWDLEDGHDAYAFMERAVSDPSITRVLVLCDPRYAEKANAREGGVGTETLIISPQVYRSVSETKFIPVIMERDTAGAVRVPLYMEGRRYIDLSLEEAGDQFERLVRTLHGKPARRRPPLGPLPEYLADDAPSLSTGRSAEMYRSAVRRNHPHANGFLRDYLKLLAAAHLRERTEGNTIQSGAALLDLVQQSISNLTPYRDEYVSLVRFIVEFSRDPDSYRELHRFFEVLANQRYGAPPTGWDFEAVTENLGFAERELFLYTSAILVRELRYDELDILLAPYHVRTSADTGGVTRQFAVHDPSFAQLANRATVNQVPRLLRERSHADVSYGELLDAEFVLTVRSGLDALLNDKRTWQDEWYPMGAPGRWDPAGGVVRARIQGAGRAGPLVRLLGFSTWNQLRSAVDLLPDLSGSNAAKPWMSRRYLIPQLGLDS